MGKFRQIRGMAEKFVDTISIFNRKRNSVKMNISGFAKIFHEQIDDFFMKIWPTRHFLQPFMCTSLTGSGARVNVSVTLLEVYCCQCFIYL